MEKHQERAAVEDVRRRLDPGRTGPPSLLELLGWELDGQHEQVVGGDQRIPRQADVGPGWHGQRHAPDVDAVLEDVDARNPGTSPSLDPVREPEQFAVEEADRCEAIDAAGVPHTRQTEPTVGDV